MFRHGGFPRPATAGPRRPDSVPSHGPSLGNDGAVSRLGARRTVLLWSVTYLGVGLVVALQENDIGQAAFYPPVAVGIAFLLVEGRRYWPVLLVLELVIASLQYHFEMPAAIVSAVVTVGEELVGTTLLIRLGFRRSIERPEDVVILGLVAAVVGGLGATIGVALLEVVGYAQRLTDHWRVWAVGEASAIAIVLPAILLWSRPGAERRARLRPLTPRGRVELALAVAVAVGALVLFFATRNVREVRVSEVGLLLLGILPIIWIALRFGPMRTSIVLPVLDATALIAFAGVGPHLVHHTKVTTLDLLPIQIAMFAVALAAMAIAVALEAASDATARESAVIAASPLAIVAINPAGTVLSWSPAAERIFGYCADEAVGRFLPIVPTDGTDAFRERIRAGAAGRLDVRVEYTRKDGTRVPARLVTAPMYDGQGTHFGTVGVIEDITPALASEQRQTLLNTAIDQAAEAIVVTDPTPAIIYANPAATSSSGYPLDELLGQNPRLFKSGIHDAGFYERMWATITQGQTWHGVLINRRRDGGLYEERTTIAPVVDGAGGIVAYVAVKHDLTRERRLEADLEREQRDREIVRRIVDRTAPQPTLEATTDALSRSIVEVVEVSGAGVLMLQPDGALLLMTRTDAPFAGYLVSPELGAHEVTSRSAEGAWWVDWTRPTRLNARFRAQHVDAGLTASAYAPVRWQGRLIGVLNLVTSAPDGPAWMPEHLGLVASLAAYAGVLIGSLTEEEGTREAARHELLRVIERREFSMVFQPYVDLTTGEVRGFEALARFADGTRPDRKILDAWAAGLGPQMEGAVARAAVAQADRLPVGVSLSVNFSPEAVLDGTAARVVRGAARPIVLEITEHIEVTDYDALRSAIAACGDVRLAVDDAGAGYASLRHILELRPDIVKLDIGLIRGIDADPGRQSLAAGLCRYAADTGVTLIGEGIETAAEAETARNLGVHCGQGYLFGRRHPRPPPPPKADRYATATTRFRPPIGPGLR